MFTKPDYAALNATRTRAGALASSGHFDDLEQIADQLEWEGHLYIKSALRGMMMRNWLRARMLAAKERGRRYDA